MQIGTRAAMTSALAWSDAIISALAPVTQPPHEKPVIASATAPTPAPISPGFTHSGVFIFVSSIEGKLFSPLLFLFFQYKEN
jgi:hypothetical protein